MWAWISHLRCKPSCCRGRHHPARKAERSLSTRRLLSESLLACPRLRLQWSSSPTFTICQHACARERLAAGNASDRREIKPKYRHSARGIFTLKKEVWCVVCVFFFSLHHSLSCDVVMG